MTQNSENSEFVKNFVILKLCILFKFQMLSIHTVSTFHFIQNYFPFHLMSPRSHGWGKQS